VVSHAERGASLLSVCSLSAYHPRFRNADAAKKNVRLWKDFSHQAEIVGSIPARIFSKRPPLQAVSFILIDQSASLGPMSIRITFTRQWGGYDRVVWIDVAKFNAAWRRERRYYLRLNSPNRTACWIVRLNFRRIPMPHVYVGEDGEVSFTDGRHRFAWFRDHGVKAIPVTVATKKDAEIARRLYGSRRKSVRLNKATFREAFLRVARTEERHARLAASFGHLIPHRN
jgi:hypothetical protein